MRSQKRIALIGVALTAALFPMSFALGATTKHPTYALGRAKVCKVGYKKVTLTKTETLHAKVKGKPVVEHVKVKYVGCQWKTPAKKNTTTVTITAPTTTTTVPKKPADPPTVLTITSDDNPAVAGDTVDYTVTVDHILSATTGVLQVFDGLTQLHNCSVPDTPTQPDGNAEITGTCSETYEGQGSFPLTGIFTGDAVYAQAAATLTETVNTLTQVAPPVGGGGGGNPSPTTTTSTTTTTLAPQSTTATETVSESGAAFTTGNNGTVGTINLGVAVTSNGQPVSIAGTDITFTFYDGSTVVGSFVGSSSNPGLCTINAEVQSARLLIDTTSPNFCTYGIPASSVPIADVLGNQFSVVATYQGDSTHLTSTSSSAFIP